MTKHKKVEGLLPVIPVPIALIVIFCSSLCYLTSYNGDFVFDDSEAIVNNNDVKETPLLEVFRNDFWGMRLNRNQSHKSYRPLTVLTFRFHYWLRNGKLLPSDFHLVNIALHILVSLLSLPVFSTFLDEKSPKISFYAATLFAVHPIHSEAVAGIVGRADILSALFTWFSVLFYKFHIHSKSTFPKWSAIIASFISIAMGMLCKETGLTAVGILAAYDLTVVNKIHPWNVKWSILSSKRNLMIRLCLLIVFSIALLLLRFSIMDFSVPTFQLVDNPASFQESYLIRLINYNYIHALNLWLLLCPDWLCFDWSMGCVPIIEDLFDNRIFVVFLYWTFLGALLISLFRQRWNLTMALVVLIVPFLPASNILFKVGFVIAERTLYVPSAGFCMLVCVGMEALSSRALLSRIVLLFYGLLTVSFFSRSWIRSGEWTTETTLFRSGIGVCPLNAKVHYNIAKNAADVGDTLMAEMEYHEALRLNPTYAQAMNNLGNLMKNQQEYEKAEELLKEAIKIKPDFAAAWMNLGITYAAINKSKDSEDCYMKALTYRSKYPDCYYNLGVSYLEQKFHQKAIKAFETAIQQKRNHKRAWINLILLLSDLGQMEKALELGKAALIFLPEDAAINFNIGNILGKIGKFEEAEKYFQTAIYYEADNALYYTNLGVLYHRWNKLKEAEELYREALKVDPNLQSARGNLRRLKSTANKQ